MKLEKSRKSNGKRSLFVLGVCAGLTLLFLCSVTGAHAKESSSAGVSSRGIKVGVVDLNMVFEKYEKRKAFDAQLKEQEKQFQKIVNDKKKELVGLNEKIQLLDLGSEARKKDEESLEKKTMELESYAKYAEKSMMKKYKEYFGNLYTEVCKEIETLGKREQYDLIIKKEEPELQSGGISELQFKVGIKAVLYHSESVDITNQVLDSLNKKQAEAGKGK